MPRNLFRLAYYMFSMSETTPVCYWYFKRMLISKILLFFNLFNHFKANIGLIECRNFEQTNPASKQSDVL